MPSRNGKKSNWAKNFGNSVKFSAIDILKDIAPNTASTMENSRDSINDVVKEIRDLRSGQSQMLQAISNSPFIKYSAQAAKNAVSDIKSGRINNQQRVDQMMEDEMNNFGMDDGDTEIDFSPTDDTSPGGGSVDFSPIASLQPSMTATAVATRQTAIATQEIGINLNKQTKVIATSFDNSIALNKQIATTTFAMNQMMHEQRMATMNTINDNLGKMVEFNNDTVSKLAMGSLKYYDDSLNVMNNILEEIKKSNRNIPEKQEEEEPEVPQYKQLFTGRGVMKFSKYPSVLKKNFIAAADEDPILNMAKEFLTNEEALKMLAANPLGNMSAFIASSLIPVTMKKFMTQLDETIGGFFPAMFAKINRGLDSDNPIMNMLAKIFGVRTSVTTSPDFSRYEKGPVPFDGITRTTINSVIPNYLSGILSALTGKEERTFDAVKGEFTTKHEMKDRYEREQTEMLTNSFSKAMNEMTKTIEQAVTFRSEEERKEMQLDMQRMFKGIALSGKLYNPEKDDLMALGVENSTNANILKAAFKSMSRGKQLSTNRSIFQSQADLSEYFENGVSKDPAMLANFLSIYGGMPFDQHIERNAYDKSKYKVNKGSVYGGAIDEFGKTQAEHLRDIKEILLEGITVYPSANAGSGHSSKMAGRLARYKKWKDSKTQDIYDEDDAGKPSMISDADRIAEKAEGKIWQNDLARMDSNQILAHLNFKKTAKEHSTESQMGGVYGVVDKYVNQETFGAKITNIKESIEKFFKSPIKLFTTAIDKIDSALYTVIYGDEKGNSIVNVAISSMKNTFSQFTGWLKKKYDAGSKYMFGEGGIKDTKMYKWAKEKGNKMMDYIFGAKTGEGTRQGGVLSGTFNSLGDIFKQTRASMFGTPYTDSEGKSHAFNKRSVFNEVKIGVLRGFKHMQTYLFGPPKKDKDGKKMSFADQMYDTLGEGYNNFKNFFFGSKLSSEDGKKEFKTIMLDFKAKMPKALAYGVIGAGAGLFTNFGILGSLFLPGGPVGGAIVGTAVGLLTQSEKFKSFMFGEKGVDGKRMGGVVSKRVVDWFGKNKTAILGGAMFGAVKGLINSTGILQSMGPLGYMTSMFLPGGPVGGAIMGAAIGIGVKSRTFQRFLYGKDDGTGKRSGGILSNSYSRAMKKHLPNMAFGALSFGAAGAVVGQMGIMGAMMTPAGPIGAAIMGAATGIAISSQKFRKYLFGEKDDKTGLQKSGLFDKISNLFKLSIIEPFKLKLEKISWGIEKWFTKSIANPFKDAMLPLKVQFKVLTDNIKTMFADGWKSMTNYLGEVFTRYVGMPLGQFMEKRVLGPMRKFMGTLVNGIGKAFGSILSSPFKALNYMAMSFQNSQENRGRREGKDERMSNLKMSVANVLHGQTNAEGQGIYANFKNVVRGYTDKDTREKDKSRIAWYRDKEAERKRKRDAEQAKYFAEGDAALEKSDAELKARRDKAKKVNFQRTFMGADGTLKDASALYDMKSEFKEVSDSIDLSNSILTKIKNIVAGFASRVTGNEGFMKYGRSKGGTAQQDKSSSLNFTTAEKARMKFTRTFQFGKDDNKPEEESLEETPGGIAGMPSQKFGRLGKMTGKKKGPKWSKFGFDLQMFATGMSGGKQGVSVMPIPGVALGGHQPKEEKRGGSTFDPTMTKEERAFERKNKGGFGNSAIKYLRIIASNVDGQLNGIGSNIYKIRKGVDTITGNDSGDEGAGNKDRVSAWGKAWRVAKMMVTNPIAFVGDIVLKPFRFVMDLGEKIMNTAMSVVNGIADTVHFITDGVMKLSSKVAKFALAIPRMMLDIAAGVGEAAKEVVIGGVKALSHGVIGLIDTSFKILSNAGAALGSILKGIGKGAELLMEGMGALGSELFKAVGQAAGLAVDLVHTAGKTAIEIGGSVVKTVGGVATAAVSGIGKVAGTIIGGVTDMITTATSAVFSLITSPFKWVGGLLNKVLPSMNMVRISGGTLDTIKTVEVVEKIKSTDGMDELISTVSGSSVASKAKRFMRRKGSMRFGNMDLQMFSDGTEVPGAPSASNVTSDMIASGLAPKGGVVKRTAAYMNAVKSSLADKLFSRTNGIKQTGLLGKLLDVTTKHTGAFGKFVKWIMVGVTALLEMIKHFKFPNIPGMRSVAGAAKEAAEKVLERGKNIASDAVGKAKGKLGQVAERLGTRISETSWYQRGTQFVKNNMPNTFGRAGGEVAEDVTAKSVPDLFGMNGGKAISGTATDIGGKAASATEEIAGKVATSQTGEAAVESVESSLEKDSSKWMKMFRQALGTLEQKASSVAGGTLKFADAIYATAAKKLTGTILAKFAGQITKAVAAMAASASTLGALDAILAVWNTGTGLADAANVFKVNAEAVTVPMRLCAAITKTAFGCTPMMIIDIILTILGAVMGFDHIQWFATTIYKLISDSDSIAKLEAEQAKFEDAAQRNGMSVDDYNNQVNKSTWDKVTDGFQNMKDSISETLFGKNDANGNYKPSVFSKINSGIGNNMAWLFGQNDSEGNYQKGAFAKMGDSVGNNMAYLFGQNGADGKFIEGAIKNKWDNTLAWLFGQNDEDGKFKDGYIKTAIHNNLAWLFGQNDEEGNYKGGVFAQAKDEVVSKWNNTLAWMFGQNDEDGNFQKGYFKDKLDNTLAWLFGYNDGNGNYVNSIFADSKEVIVDKWNNTLAWLFGQDNADGEGKEEKGIIKKKMDEGLSWMFGENDGDGKYKPGIFAEAGNKLEETISSIKGTWNTIEDGAVQFYNDIRDMVSAKYQVIKDTVSGILDEIDEHMGRFFGLKNDDGSSYVSLTEGIKNGVSEAVDNMEAKGGALGWLAKGGRYLYNKAFPGSGKGDGPIVRNQFTGAGDGTPSEQNGFTYYSQEDPRWKDNSYGGTPGMGKFGDSGCAPTAMAMVASDLTGQKVSPDAMAQYSLTGGYRVPGGTTESFFSSAGRDLGLNPSQVAGKADMVNQLAQGNPVVLGGTSSNDSVGNPFTKAGHYSVAVGLSSDGTKAIMNDPRGPQYSKAVDINKLASQTVTGYSFQKGFSGSGKRRPTFRGAGNITGDDILAAGEEQMGLPYRLGGDGRSSTDCGKFTLDTFDKCNLDLTIRTADDQYKLFEDHGAIIDPSSAKPGDLLFFSSEDNGYAGVGHVGIYAGNNYVLNAATSTGVAYADLSNYWGDRIVGAGSVQKMFGVKPGVGKGPGSITSSGKRGKGGTAKPKTLLDLMGHISSMYGNLATSVIGGKVYTGTPWETDSSGGSGRSAGSIGGGNVDRKTVYKFYKDQGYSDVAIAGIMGNIEQEHHFNTSDVQLDTSSGQEVGGLGMFQWTRGRADAMRDFASSSNRSATDAGAQLDYMMHEVNNGGYDDVSPSSMNGIGSPSEAAAYFNRNFEKGTMGDRQQYAEEFYQKIQNGEFAGAGFGDVWSKRLKAYGFMGRRGVNPSILRRPGGFQSVEDMMDRSNRSRRRPSNKPGSVASTPKTTTQSSQSPVVQPEGIVQANISTFTGGEYFNDPSKVTQAARAFAAGTGSLLNVAKSVGFDGIPSDDTPLTVEQQQMLGFREFSPVRTWAHYTVDSQLWRTSGKTSVESWMDGKTPIAQTTTPTTVNRVNPTTSPSVEKVNKQVATGAATEVNSTLKNQVDSSSSDGILQKVLEVLNNIADNTDGINGGVDKLVKSGGIIIDNGRGGQTFVALNNGGGNQTNQLLDPNGGKPTSAEYDYNRKIAAGGKFVK